MAEQTFSPSEAREQAAEYLGMLASVKIKVEDAKGAEVFEVPNPTLLDDEQQKRYDALQFSLEALERYPDVKDADGNVIRRGEPLEPHRDKEGKLVEHYNIRLAKAIFGDVGYKRFVAGGGRGNDVAAVWYQMQKRLTEAAKQDPK
jgi:hypothetical protein